MFLQGPVHTCSLQHYSQQAKSRNTPNAHQLLKKQNVAYLYHVILFSNKRRTEILRRVTTWMNLGNILPRERSRHKRAYSVSPQIYKMTRKSTDVRSTFVVSWGYDWNQEATANGHTGPFLGDDNVLPLDCGAGYTTL